MIERLGNLGYGALGKESTPGVPVTPSIFFKFYKSTLNTKMNLDKDNPIAGVRSSPFNQFMGMRSHGGSLEVLAEPYMAEYWFDMFLAAGNITGSGDPYTHPFNEGLSNSYTIELLKGKVVERYFGCMADSITHTFDKNKMMFTLDIVARGSFIMRKIKTISTTTITLDTDYDPVAPNLGLVAGDLITISSATGGVGDLATTIAAAGVHADGITVVLSNSAAAFAVGDWIFLRAQTASYSDLYPFVWARTQFQFGTSASAALSAAQLQLEKGSKWTLKHSFENKDGAQRSGSYDPASLVRLQTEADLNLKAFFDQPTLLQNYLDVAAANSLVIRHFSSNNHELRLTFNQLKYDLDKRDFDSGKIIYEDITGVPNYSPSDGQMFSASVINATST